MHGLLCPSLARCLRLSNGFPNPLTNTLHTPNVYQLVRDALFRNKKLQKG